MARSHILAVAVALMAAACHRSARIPQTSPEAEQLRWLDPADVQADFRDYVERQHDTRFISVYGLSFATEFPGLEDTPDAQRLVREHGSRRIQNTDIFTNWEHHHLMDKSFDYAKRYNAMLLVYLASHTNT